MADFGQVNADLMRAARFQPAFDDRVAGELLHRPDVRDRPLCAFGRFAQRRAAAEAVAAVADQPGVDRLRLLDAAVDDGHIGPLHFVPGEHADQLLLRLAACGQRPSGRSCRGRGDARGRLAALSAVANARLWRSAAASRSTCAIG